MEDLQAHIERVSQNLQGYGRLHPASMGRVIELDAPYKIPKYFELRSIAGVVLIKEQNPDIKEKLDTLSDEERQKLLRQSGLFSNGKIGNSKPMGPYTPAPFAPPDYLKPELQSLCEIFECLTGANEIRIHFPNGPAPQFHIDGSVGIPGWRMTYVFNDKQTQWHTKRREANTPVMQQGPVGFPIIPDAQMGKEGTDFFAAKGALMFLTNSPNGLFHRTPPGISDKRLMVTLDSYAPKREDCSKNCPFPCRTIT